MGKLFIGTSGFNYKDWKGSFYPEGQSEKKWLSYYSKHFRSVEINASFYRDFPKSVYQKWKEETEKDFLFTIKGSRFITHLKKLSKVSESVNIFFEHIAGLSEKLGMVLWQFPGNFQKTDKSMGKLSDFIEILPAGIRQVFEFRHQSWFTDDLYSLLDDKKMGLVINDSAKFPKVFKVCGKFAYIRFHGPGALYSSQYNSNQLKKWALIIRKYLKTYDVYSYFNNDVNAFAVSDASKLKQLIN